MIEQRGASNPKAKSEFNWEPRIKSWRDGFRIMYKENDAK